ncbi:hypothetical protein KW548_05645 [Vibrio neptunius]|nr:hypothetical protein [Vibrio neptunius]QXX07490.1 hypothetical protein KW548_05645 [Vibrio neptunius]
MSVKLNACLQFLFSNRANIVSFYRHGQARESLQGWPITENEGLMTTSEFDWT